MMVNRRTERHRWCMTERLIFPQSVLILWSASATTDTVTAPAGQGPVSADASVWTTRLSAAKSGCGGIADSAQQPYMGPVTHVETTTSSRVPHNAEY